MKAKICYLTMALVLALSLTVVAPPLVSPTAADPGTVTPEPFQRTVTPGVSESTFEFSSAETVDGIHSVKLGVINLQNEQEGIKTWFRVLGIDFAPYGEGGLQNIDASSISLKVKGDVLSDGVMARSPYPLIAIWTGHDTADFVQIVKDHGDRVYFYPTDASGSGPEITVTGDPMSEWATVTPAYPQYWKAFFLDGQDLGEVLDPPILGPTDLVSWHEAISQHEDPPGITLMDRYRVMYLGVGYGSVSGSTATAYVDDLAVNGVTYDFEPSAGSSSGCFIATAAYGTATAEQLDVLRAFRDQVLLQSPFGSGFVAWYYQASPPVADLISQNSLLRTVVRQLLIDPMVGLAKLTRGIWGD